MQPKVSEDERGAAVSDLDDNAGEELPRIKSVLGDSTVSTFSSALQALPSQSHSARKLGRGKPRIFIVMTAVRPDAAPASIRARSPWMRQGEFNN